MRKETTGLETTKVSLVKEIHKVQAKLDSLQKDKDALLLKGEAAQNMSTP